MCYCYEHSGNAPEPKLSRLIPKLETILSKAILFIVKYPYVNIYFYKQMMDHYVEVITILYITSNYIYSSTDNIRTHKNSTKLMTCFNYWRTICMVSVLMIC